MSKFKKILAGKVLFILLAAGALSYIDATTELSLGLDLRGGTQLDYMLDLSQVEEADQSQIIEGVQEVIRKRVDSLGVSEPNIYTSNIADEYHVVVELAGVEDVEEAKNTVGKTIQLEFREENTEPSDEQLKLAQDSSNAFYNQILKGTDFETLAKAEQDRLEGDATYFTANLKEISSYSQEVQDAIAGKGIGSILAPFETNEGYVANEDGMISQVEGLAVLEITDRSTETEEVVIPEEVSARHILVSYEGGERSEATRSKEEAQARAQEVLALIQEGQSIEELAEEWSDDTASAAQGGDLGSFKRGVMTEVFEDTAFGLEVGETSEIIETPFGFHILNVYEKQEESTTTEEKEMVAMKKIVYNTTPDPWKEEAVLTGEHFKHADVAFDQSYQPLVSITFTNEGAKLFEELTGNNIGKQIAIFVGGQLISAPTVQSKIGGGEAQITGTFTLEEAQTLARDLNTGAIPAPIELVGQYTISATLGAEALEQSLYAGLVGLLILAVYMLFYYRLPGLIADIALLIYAVLLIFFVKVAMPTLAALLIGIILFSYLVHLILKNKDSGGEKFISFLLACVVLFFMTFVLSSPVTLTLAGIAGVILSIGMAVDANILIFERMKEELQDGKNIEEAIRDGFSRAWDSIRDSNFSSLITCAILFYFGSSIIRGFALNLALGILVSMFSAIMLTRTFLYAAAQTRLKDKLWLFGKPKKKKTSMLKIVQNSRIWAGLSGLVLAAAIVSIGAFGLKMGIDFTGGTLMEVQFGIDDEGVAAEENAETEAIDVTTDQVTRAILTVEEELQSDFGNPQVVSTDQGTFIIRIKHVSETEHDALLSQFRTEFQDVSEVRFTTVGPTIGETLKKKAVIALIITLIMIVFYIAFAFRKIPKELSPWRFGFASIAALVHDILIVVGVFAILGYTLGVEVDALFITALLTIMGFSVHDTIVVFDRVRENLNYRKSEDDLATTTNKALNQTMARSLNTSISTLITILALLILGAESIFWFVLALAIGIVAGTYSSIFVASPIVVWWNEKWPKN